ncbi:hypothetical protein GCM10027168_50150 [Streptomyces capparidis]
MVRSAGVWSSGLRRGRLHLLTGTHRLQGTPAFAAGVPLTSGAAVAARPVRCAGSSPYSDSHVFENQWVPRERLLERLVTERPPWSIPDSTPGASDDCQGSWRTATGLRFCRAPRGDAFPMTHHVERVAILEPAAKGSDLRFSRTHDVRCGRCGRYLDAEMTLGALI